MDKEENKEIKMGRPSIEIDVEEFEKLCNIQCTELEIAGFFNCSDDTINNWCKKQYGETFSEVFKKLSAPGKISLRRTQFRQASESVPMAIWLGKQYLGQTDKVDTDLITTPEVNIRIVDNTDFEKVMYEDE